MGGDFNAKTGEMEAGIELDSERKEEEEERGKRKKKLERQENEQGG